jgi:hypothetical protein
MARGDSGIVDENRYIPDLLLDRRRQLRAGGCVRNIKRECTGLPTASPDIIRRLIRVLGIDIGHDDARTVLRKALGDRSAIALSGASDKADPVLKQHAISPDLSLFQKWAGGLGCGPISVFAPHGANEL